MIKSIKKCNQIVRIVNNLNYHRITRANCLHFLDTLRKLTQGEIKIRSTYMKKEAVMTRPMASISTANEGYQTTGTGLDMGFAD